MLLFIAINSDLLFSKVQHQYLPFTVGPSRKKWLEFNDPQEVDEQTDV